MIKLYNDDCFKIMPMIESESIHLILSDIPYGIGYDDWDILHHNTNMAYGGSSKAQNEAGGMFKRRGKPLNGWSEADKKIPYEYQKWCSMWSPDWFRILKPGGSCFIFAGRRYAHRCVVAMEDVGFTFKDMIAWDKGHAMFRAQRVSAVFERRQDKENVERWRGWRLANTRPLFEPILWFQKPYKVGSTITDNLLDSGIGAWNESVFAKYNIGEYEPCSNIIKVKKTKFDVGLHPTQKPINIIKFLIELTTLENQIVLDLFMGSGTTGLACRDLNRNFVGIELNKSYFKIAKNRIEE